MLACHKRLAMPGFCVSCLHISQSSLQGWFGLRKMLTAPPIGCCSRPVFTQSLSVFHCLSAISSCQLCGISLSRFSSSNYGFSFTVELTLFGATSGTWQATKVIVCPVLFPFCLSFKTRTGLCFSLKFAISPCY